MSYRACIHRVFFNEVFINFANTSEAINSLTCSLTVNILGSKPLIIQGCVK